MTGSNKAACHIIGIDQSTQGTKVLLFNEKGRILYRADRPHTQIITGSGWVSHDPEEIYHNLIDAVREITAAFPPADHPVTAVGISNQRETTAVWDKDGSPIMPAIVWQCGRAASVTDGILIKDPEAEKTVRRISGLTLTPYFSAAKMAWILQHAPVSGGMHLGTMDSYLVYRLTGGKSFMTDAGNASRTQLMDLESFAWSDELLDLFGIPESLLPEINDSNADFGSTDFEGLLPSPIPILAVLGDSHAALLGHGCSKKGMTKVTYGTGSSVMMNTGERLIRSEKTVSCAAWRIGGVPAYCLEGNINYTGAVITWLKDDVHLIDSTAELEPLVLSASREDSTVLVPAFTGLSAPYWDSSARAALMFMSRTTGRAEIARAALNSIAYQINDVLEAMVSSSGISLKQVRVDGGPTRNRTLMQFQSDISGCTLLVPEREELSAMGAAYLAGITAGVYNEDALMRSAVYTVYEPHIRDEERTALLSGWHSAVNCVIKQ